MMQKAQSLSLNVVVVAGMLALPLAAMASTDPLIEGARQCTQYFPVEEKKNSIPTHLLAAIATTESGRYHKGLGMSVPWPWTINVEGKGYHFDTKAEAIAQTQSFLAKGYRSIDVGCMQVNLKHHPKAFSDLNQAFDPAANVAYSAKFLRTNYTSLGDWIKATAAYHSRTDIYAQRYLVSIERSWNSIVGKVNAARASKAGGNPPAVQVASRAPVAENPPQATRAASPMRAAQKVRVIRVSEAPRRSSGEVLIVRPSAPAPAPVAVATVTVTPAAAALPQGSSIRRVNLDNRAASAVSTEPKFVFAN